MRSGYFQLWIMHVRVEKSCVQVFSAIPSIPGLFAGFPDSQDGQDV